MKFGRFVKKEFLIFQNKFVYEKIIMDLKSVMDS